MIEAIMFIIGLAFGGAAGVYIGILRGRGRAEVENAVTAGEVAGLKASLEEVRSQVGSKDEELALARKAGEEAVAKVRVSLETDLAALRKTLEAEKVTSAKTNERLDSSREHFAEQRRQIEEMEKKVKDSFHALSAAALKSNNEQFVTLAEAKMKPFREQLERYEKQINSLEKAREKAYGGLTEKLQSLEDRERQLGKETGQLVAALRQSGAKGKWGEATLQRVVELSGMTKHCDFDTQVTLESGQRPDLVVRMPGGRTLVVDSKVNTGAYLDAVDAVEEPRREEYLNKYITDVRGTMRALSAKTYWKQFEQSPEFVVMFMPGEAFFAEAISRDRDLLKDGIDKGVVLASPTTLMALLMAVQYGWQQQQMAENAKEIANAGRELYNRLCLFVGHLDKVRDGIQKAAGSYNEAVGSWERRTLPSARKLKELGAAEENKDVPELRLIDAKMRPFLPQDEDSGVT